MKIISRVLLASTCTMMLHCSETSKEPMPTRSEQLVSDKEEFFQKLIEYYRAFPIKAFEDCQVRLSEEQKKQISALMEHLLNLKPEMLKRLCKIGVLIDETISMLNRHPERAQEFLIQLTPTLMEAWSTFCEQEPDCAEHIKQVSILLQEVYEELLPHIAGPHRSLSAIEKTEPDAKKNDPVPTSNEPIINQEKPSLPPKDNLPQPATDTVSESKQCAENQAQANVTRGDFGASVGVQEGFNLLSTIVGAAGNVISSSGGHVVMFALAASGVKWVSMTLQEPGKLARQAEEIRFNNAFEQLQKDLAARNARVAKRLDSAEKTLNKESQKLKAIQKAAEHERKKHRKTTIAPSMAVTEQKESHE